MWSSLVANLLEMTIFVYFFALIVVYFNKIYYLCNRIRLNVKKMQINVMNLKLRILKYSLLLLLVVVCPIHAANVKYGLSFNSHLFPVKQRTSLLLDNGTAIPVDDELEVSFSLLVRGNEPAFGSILHLTADDGQVIHFSIVMDGKRNVPALVFNDDIAFCHAIIVPEKWQNVTMKVQAKKNKITLVLGGKEQTFTVPMNGTKTLKIQFGRIDSYVSDVAPMILKDVKVSQNGHLKRWWKLYRHNGDVCLDEESKQVASAINPLWIIDNHIQWKQIYHAKRAGRLGVAFNAKKSMFYLCTDREVISLNNHGDIVKQQKVLGGYKANTKSNGFVAYDGVNDDIVSFSLRTGVTSRFSLDKSRWSLLQRNDSTAFYYNHAGVYDLADSSYYFFGGYGFYTYHNDLFRLKAGSDKIERLNYSNPIPPRFGAAMGIANGKLYILGGRGNKSGKQAVESYFYAELWSIDLKTMKAEVVWQRNTFPKGGILAQTMFYQPKENAFYALNMNDRGGTMYQVNIADTTITEVAKPIGNTLAFQDFDFNMFYSPVDGCFYLVIDKILVDKTHDLSIYQLSTPLLSDTEIAQSESKGAGIFEILIVVACVLLLFGGIFLYYVRKRSKKVPSKLANSTATRPMDGNPQNMEPLKTPIAEENPAVQQHSTPQPQASQSEVPQLEQEEKEESVQEELVKHFDRTRAAVSLLGTFSVYDKEGEDITTQFTPRLKELLLLLILYSEKRRHGVSVDKVTEIIWFDKDEASARNNRNVTLRKLRVLLEKVGNVEIISSNGYLTVRWGKDVFCDYHAICEYVTAYNNGEYEDTDDYLSRMLEILLYGPLLPGYETEWLDEFKDANSSLSIDLLNKLLRQEESRQNDKMTLCIADIMFLHDPLNDEALAAKVRVLCRQGKKGIAKRTYDRFCKEYKDSMAEDYEIAFADLAK